MVKPVDRIIPDFAEAGASIITFHPEPPNTSIAACSLSKSTAVSGPGV